MSSPSRSFENLSFISCSSLSPDFPLRTPPRHVVLSFFSGGGACGIRAASVHTGQRGYGDPYGLPGSPLHSEDTSEDASRRWSRGRSRSSKSA
uniref:Uncharacterized protein n=1 Tax=Arundo donax TaxID=35708 RepID=A0A0A8ZH41_ARUDO